MSIGKHRCVEPATDPTYTAEWSGVSYTPHCPNGCTCAHGSGEALHLEGGNHYCPHHDDFEPGYLPNGKRCYAENPEEEDEA